MVAAAARVVDFYPARRVVDALDGGDAEEHSLPVAGAIDCEHVRPLLLGSIR